MTELVKWNEAVAAIAAATTVDEVKDIRDRAEAMRAYLKQAGETLEVQNNVADIKLRAERKAGQLLKDTERQQRGRPEKTSHDVTNKPPTLDDLGISRKQSSRLQLMAELDDDEFVEHVEKTKAAGEELTTVSVVRKVTEKRRAANVAANKVVEQSAPVVHTDSTQTYATLVIDPPWPMVRIEREVSPTKVSFDYPTMDLEEIRSIDIPAHDDAFVFLWTTQKFLPFSFDLLEHWGFRYLVCMVWHKPGGFQPFGLPQFNGEFVLVGRRGSIDFLDAKDFPCVFEAPRREHSRKPDRFYDIVRRTSPAPRLDMFSREARPGFAQYGNQTKAFS